MAPLMEKQKERILVVCVVNDRATTKNVVQTGDVIGSPKESACASLASAAAGAAQWTLASLRRRRRAARLASVC